MALRCIGSTQQERTICRELSACGRASAPLDEEAQLEAGTGSLNTKGPVAVTNSLYVWCRVED